MTAALMYFFQWLIHLLVSMDDRKSMINITEFVLTSMHRLHYIFVIFTNQNMKRLIPFIY
jgi:hypothetical protein